MPEAQQTLGDWKCSLGMTVFQSVYDQVYCRLYLNYRKRHYDPGTTEQQQADYDTIVAIVRTYTNLVLQDETLPEVNFEARQLSENTAQLRLTQRISSASGIDAGIVGEILRELYALTKEPQTPFNDIIRPRTARNNAPLTAPTEKEKKEQDESLLGLLKQYGKTAVAIAALIGIGYIGTNVYRSYALVRSSKQ
jgi:hypothetical protein